MLVSFLSYLHIICLGACTDFCVINENNMNIYN